MDISIYFLAVLLPLQTLAVWYLWKLHHNNAATDADSLQKSMLEKLDSYEKTLRDEFSRIRTENAQAAQVQRTELEAKLDKFEAAQKQTVNDQNNLLRDKLAEVIVKQEKLNEEAEKRIKEVKKTVEDQLKEIRDDNSKQLEEMRKTVDEKLEETLQILTTYLWEIMLIEDITL